ncbi:MAG TPA: tetratricopeptide repeat protein [Blastocatellia bacterium]|nr:tetratricopeptide repeat protein [Blastocatellia bacterium]
MPGLARLPFSIFFAFIVLSGGTTTPTTAQTSSPSPQAVFDAAVRDFYAALAEHDAAKLGSLFSEQANRFDSSSLIVQEINAKGAVSFSNISVSIHTVEGDRAAVQVGVTRTVADPTGTSVQMAHLSRVFYFVMENGAWKVREYVSPADSLGKKLLTADPKEWPALLAAAKELITPDLLKAVVQAASGSYLQSQYPQAINRYNLALLIAVYIHDQEATGNALLGLANAYRSKAAYPQAQEYYKKALATFQSAGRVAGVADTFDNMALSYSMQHNYKTALEFYEKALNQFEALGNDSGVINEIESIADVYSSMGNYDSALEFFNKSLALRERLNFQPGIESVFLNIGSLEFHEKRYDLALAAYQNALKAMENTRDKTLEADALSRVGDVYFAQHNYTAGLEYYEKALSAFEALGDKKAEVGILEDIANLYVQQRLFNRAVEYFRKSRALAESLNAKPSVASLENSIGRAYQAYGDFTAAIEHYDRALKEYEGLRDKPDTTGVVPSIIGTLQNIASAQFARAAYGAAIDYYKRSLRLADETHDDRAIINGTLGIGLAYAQQGNYPEALDNYDKGMEVATRLGDKRNLGGFLQNKGIVYYSQANYGPALQFDLESLALSDELKDVATTAGVLANIGIVESAVGNYDAALEYYQKSLAIEEQRANKDGVARALGNIGGVYYLLEQYPAAIDFLNRSLKLRQEQGDQSGVAASLATIGNVYFAQKDYANALSRFQDSLARQEQLGAKEAVAFLLAGIASVQQAQGNPEAALASAQKTAAIAAEIGNRELHWYARFKQGNAYRSLNQPSQAQAAYQDASKEIDSILASPGSDSGQQRVLEGRSVPYLGMVDLLIDQGQAAEAFAYAEMAKVQELLDMIDNSRARIEKEMTADERETQHKLIGELVSTNTQIYKQKVSANPDQTELTRLAARLTELQSQDDSFITKLSAIHPALKTYQGRLKPLVMDQALDMINDPKTAFLEYVTTEDNTYLFVLTKSDSIAKTAVVNQDVTGDGASPFPLTVYNLRLKPMDLAQQVLRFRGLIANRSGEYKEAAASLYNLLLAPAKEALAGKTHIVVAPDRLLWQLPFEALQSGPDHFLIEDFAISYAPSIAALKAVGDMQLSATASSTPDLAYIGFAHPVVNASAIARARLIYKDENVASPPDSDKEVAAAAAVYGPGHSRTYTGAQAREATFKAEKGALQVIHLATPALVDDRNPFNSIILWGGSDDSKQDGLFEIREMIDMSLNAGILVLSTSDIPTRRLFRGDGIPGLAWAAFVAGSPTTVIARWGGSAEAAPDFETAFHKNLKAAFAGGASRFSKAESLRQAMLSVLRNQKSAHPYFWSGYALVGAP